MVERVAPAIITIITAAPIDQERVAVVVVEKYVWWFLEAAVRAFVGVGGCDGGGSGRRGSPPSPPPLTDPHKVVVVAVE